NRRTGTRLRVPPKSVSPPLGRYRKDRWQAGQGRPSRRRQTRPSSANDGPQDSPTERHCRGRRPTEGYAGVGIRSSPSCVDVSLLRWSRLALVLQYDVSVARLAFAFAQKDGPVDRSARKDLGRSIGPN